MQLLLLRTPSGLLPHDEASVNAVKKIPIGECILSDWKPKRNIKFHEKYFALLNAVLVNQSHYKTIGLLHEAVKFRAGYFETLITHKGEKFLKVKSIAFHSMDEVEFNMFYQRALDVCVELTDKEAVNYMINTFG